MLIGRSGDAVSESATGPAGQHSQPDAMLNMPHPCSSIGRMGQNLIPNLWEWSIQGRTANGARLRGRSTSRPLNLYPQELAALFFNQWLPWNPANHEHEDHRRTSARRGRSRGALRHNASRNRQLHLAAPCRSQCRCSNYSHHSDVRARLSRKRPARSPGVWRRAPRGRHVRRRGCRRSAPRRSLRAAY